MSVFYIPRRMSELRPRISEILRVHPCTGIDPRLIGAYFILASAVFVDNGAFNPFLLIIVLLSFILATNAVIRPKPLSLGVYALALLLVWSWLLALVRPPGLPGGWLTVPATGLALYFIFTLSGLFVTLRGLLRKTRALHFWALMLCYLGAGGLQILMVPNPRIDVHWLQQAGAQSLVGGENPYSTHIPNLYPNDDTQTYFGDARAALNEYPYPPFSLLLTMLGWWTAGDVRWTLLAAQLASAFFLWQLARRRGHPDSIALGLTGAWLLHPRGLYVLEQSWTEPVIFAAWLFLLFSVSRPSRCPSVVIAACSFFSAKQYSVLVFPLLAVWRERQKALLFGGILAALIIVPFFVWNPTDFWTDVVLFQTRQPFRPDALSIPAFIAWATGWEAPSVLSLSVWAVFTAWILYLRKTRIEDDPVRTWALSAGVMYFAFFLLAKMAFCNYYYFVGSLLLASAATGNAKDETYKES